MAVRNPDGNTGPGRHFQSITHKLLAVNVKYIIPIGGKNFLKKMEVLAQLSDRWGMMNAASVTLCFLIVCAPEDTKDEIKLELFQLKAKDVHEPSFYTAPAETSKAM